MSKELEALEIIKKASTKSSGWMDDSIEYAYNCEIQTIEKSLKAFEIIKKKRVDVNMLVIFIEDEERRVKASNYYKGIALKDYNKSTYLEKLTKEEFDLLKEELL